MKRQVGQFWNIVYSHVPKTRPKSGITWDLLIHSVPPAELATLNDIRRAFFDRLYKTMYDVCRPFCTLNEAGSVTPTSDIDVSILYVQPIPVLRVVSEYSHGIWGKEVNIGMLLAINFYTHNWYVPCGSRVGPNLVEDCAPLRDFPFPDAVLNRQIGWSMQRLMDTALVKASPFYAEAQRVRAFINEHKHLHLTTHLQRMLDNVGAADDLPANFDRTSMVAYVEEDAFYSVGAYLHVVVKMQKKRRIALPPKMYVMSFYDNLGFLQHTAPDAVGSAAKYTYRCLRALAQLKAPFVNRKKTRAVLRVVQAYLAAKKAGDATGMTAALAKFQGMFPVKDDLMAWLAGGGKGV